MLIRWLYWSAESEALEACERCRHLVLDHLHLPDISACILPFCILQYTAGGQYRGHGQGC